MAAPPKSTAREDLLAELEAHLPPQLLGKVRQRLEWAELRVLLLEEKLRLQRIAKYGPGSERLSAGQLELLELEPGVSAEEVAAEAGRAPLGAEAEAPRSSPPARRAHPGRQALPEQLPRVVTVLRCPPAPCRGCGQEMAVLGYDESERLEVKPAEYYAAVTRREKRACTACQAGGVAMAPLPAAIIPKGIASDRVVIDTLVAKYDDHCPLYRQSRMLARDSGVEISRATLDGWVMQVGESLQPLVQVMARELLAGAGGRDPGGGADA